MTETIANPEVMTAKITNDCTCTYCPACGLGYLGDCEKCDACGGETKYDKDCFGCYEDSIGWVKELLDEWKTRNGEPEYIRINGSAMGWRRLTGYSDTTADVNEMFDKLSLNGDWRLEFTLTGADMKIVRRSHDELGASFTLAPLDQLED